MAEPFSRPESFADRTILVCGTGMAGQSAIRALIALGSRVLVTDDRAEPPVLPEKVHFCGRLPEPPDDVDALFVSPGLPPTHPLIAAAIRRGLPVFGEIEFAWRIQQESVPDWLLVTGTNGKTTTVRMLESILLTAGLRAAAVGNVGVPIIDAVRAEPPFQVLAVEASSFQLEMSSSLQPRAGVVLNLAEDHLDWHGSMAAYAAAKTKVWAGERAIGNADDALVRALLTDASSSPVWFRLGPPSDGEYGVRDGRLITAAGADLIGADEIRPSGPHNLANALAAAALAVTVGVAPATIAAGLRAFVPDQHRNEFVAEHGQIRYIDDSKATNPHAAAASLASYQRVIWIAGGQLKGADVEPLVAEYAERMVGAVVLGVDRDRILAALARHAPDLPVIEVSRTDHGAMQETVAAAASLAVAGDVVLLAPAAASKDMFASYGARGDAFAAAVRTLANG